MFIIKIKNLFIFFMLIFYVEHSFASENKIVALVNGSYSIWSYDIAQKAKLLTVITGKPSSSNQKEIDDFILNKIIDDYLIMQEVQKYKFSASNSEVSAYINNIETSLGLKAGKLLEKAKSYGIEESEFMEYIKDEATLNKFRQEYSFSRSKVSKNEIEMEIKKFLEFNGKRELQLAQISVSLVGKDEGLAKEKIDFIYNELKNKNFANVARVSSEDLLASNGGELGYIIEDYLPKPVLNEINLLSIGEFTKPILIGNNYRIFQLKDIRPLLRLNPDNPEHLAQLREFAKQKLTFEKARVVLEDYSRELYQNASIVIYK